MPQKRIVNLAFPVGGVDRSTAYQTQPPYTTPDALNVRPDSASDRERGGSRPGMDDLRPAPGGIESPVNLLADVHRAQADTGVGGGRYMDDFQRQNSGNLGAAWWGAFEHFGGDEAFTPQIVEGRATSLRDDETLSAITVDPIKANRGFPTQVSILVLPVGRDDPQFIGRYLLYDNLSPNFTKDQFRSWWGLGGRNGWFLTTGRHGGTEDIHLFSMDLYGAVPGAGIRLLENVPVIDMDEFEIAPIWLHLRTTPGDGEVRIRCGWSHSPVVDDASMQIDYTFEYQGGSPLSETKRIGFGVVSEAGRARSKIESFHAAFVPTDSEAPPKPRSVLASSLNGSLYAETEEGPMELVPPSTPEEWDRYGPWSWSLPDRYLFSASRGSDLFIPSAEPPVMDTIQMGAEFQPIENSILMYPLDADDLGIELGDIDPGGDVCVLSYVGIGLEGVGTTTSVHRVLTTMDIGDDGMHSDKQRLMIEARELVDPDQYEAFTAQVYRGAKVYHTDTGDYELWQSRTATLTLEGEGDNNVTVVARGAVPFDCSLAARYRDRIVLAGSYRFPNLWYMSRHGDPYDFDYFPILGGDDTGRPIAGNTSDAGEIGEPITSLVPFSDDYLLIGCHHSLWRIVGDPAFGGEIDNVSRIIGIVSGSSWCWGPEGQLFWISVDGLYAMMPGAGSFPQSVSRELLPAELINVDPKENTITMEYDSRHRGIHIIVTRIGGDSSQRSWWFDWEAKSFWEQSFVSDRSPTYLLYSRADDVNHTGMIIGCRDGKIRKFGVSFGDSGTSYDTRLLLGPIRLGRSINDSGLVSELHATLGEGSAELSWWMFSGESAEEAFAKITDDKSNASASGTWSGGGIQYATHPRVRGHSVYLLMEGDSAAWSFEWANMGVNTAGRQRLL